MKPIKPKIIKPEILKRYEKIKQQALEKAEMREDGFKFLQKMLKQKNYSMNPKLLKKAIELSKLVQSSEKARLTKLTENYKITKKDSQIEEAIKKLKQTNDIKQIKKTTNHMIKTIDKKKRLNKIEKEALKAKYTHLITIEGISMQIRIFEKMLSIAIRNQAKKN